MQSSLNYIPLVYGSVAFGDCKCGHTKAEHSQEALTATPAKHEEPPPAPKVAESYKGPCENFTGKVL